ncbi:KAP family NTPase [Klebsiella quasipneumoniae]|uniref:KAP family P-loop NTPase fold protein n=1 Tax=Klebsiella quasipneumoniae TaxID=1463165 RepID=UPI002DB85EC8|nr:P-loop NTPase fold protein [Klebsiella quasipneumoniae]MEB7830363.1 KAP family NTPase [Klebsiella quasipneumoniae]
MTQTPEVKPQGKHLDRAVISEDEDRYGYSHIATELAHAIQGIGRKGSAVIGIEGAWGTGKTSLLNLLRAALEKQKEDRTYVLSISPWLDGSDTSLVASLLLPVAGIIATEEERLLPAGELAELKKKEALTRTARTLMDYTRATARNLSPLAKFAAIIPGIPDASGALTALSESRWLKEKEKTTTEMRAEISEKIAELDLSFIVMLDDLDRLEPAQAVEVIRLVKSVADFPRFRYLLCYDKAVLSEAIRQGLGVTDGSLYLQKIVQISFGLPRPESFVLRREFRDAAAELYRMVNGRPPEADVMEDLTRVADIYGGALKTPREVQIVLNALRFRYAGMRDYVYFPDLCFLLLLRTTNPGLYDWVEEYLSERAVVESGDGHISDKEMEVLTKSLNAHLMRYFPARAYSASELSEWVPGISGGLAQLPVSLFNRTAEGDSAMLTAGKRLGSLPYWRYYFAFSAPQNVLEPKIFEELFALARQPEQQQALAKQLLGYIQSKNLSTRTWFEHILAQMTKPLIESRTSEECCGLLQFFFDTGDSMLERYRVNNEWFVLHDLDTYSVTDRLITRMFRDNADHTAEFLSEKVKNGQAWYWIAEYVRHLLWQHGMAGNREKHELQPWLPLEILGAVQEALAERLNGDEVTDRLVDFPLMNSYVWAWRDISGNEAVRKWVDTQTQDDEAFLKLLLQLRYHGVSSAAGRYRALALTNMTEILGDVDAITGRITRIKEAGHCTELVAQIEQSIERNRF